MWVRGAMRQASQPAVTAVALESTMSRIALCAVASIAAVWTVSAQAADLPYRAPYTVNQPLNAYSWAVPISRQSRL